MAVIIRLTRTGKKGEGRYRMVVKEKRSRRDGKAIEILGWYQKGKEGKKSIKAERVQYWLSQGAKTSEAVAKILAL